MNKIILSIVVCVIIFVSSNLFPQTQQFTDVAAIVGVDPPVQLIRGSVSFCDFNGDGFDDLSFSSAQDFPLFIYKNQNGMFTDVTLDFQLTDLFRTMQLLWADYDNDGDKDLFCAVDLEPNYSRLYRNEGGYLVDVTLSSGIGTVASSCNAAAFADYDNDGWLDLFVTHYSEFTSNYLYRNNGDGTFTDVTEFAGVSGFDTLTGYYRLPFAVAFFDFNNDGWMDFHICNDHFTGDYQYLNNGDGTFTEVGVSSGSGVEGFMMGIAVGDYDENGFLDMYLSNDPFGNYLLKNNGDGTFTDVAENLGVTVNKSCWGTNFFDYDNDGDLDLFVCTEIGQNAFFKNNGDETFTQLTGIGLDGDIKSFGCAVGDFDNNGFTDLAVHNEQSKPCVYKNSGGNNNWLKINLIGVNANRDGIGTRIEAYLNGRKLIRETTCGISYMSQNSNTTIIGAGSNSIIDSVIVKWPGSGTVDILRNVSVNQTITLHEGETIVSVNEGNNLPSEFKLLQNYPNPFNPSTIIAYKLPENSMVKLTVYNLLGETINVLVNGYVPAGVHEFNFNAQNLNSGVYIYKLEAISNNGKIYNDFKKMILIK